MSGALVFNERTGEMQLAKGPKPSPRVLPLSTLAPGWLRALAEAGAFGEVRSLAGHAVTRCPSGGWAAYDLAATEEAGAECSEADTRNHATLLAQAAALKTWRQCDVPALLASVRKGVVTPSGIPLTILSRVQIAGATVGAWGLHLWLSPLVERGLLVADVAALPYLARPALAVRWEGGLLVVAPGREGEGRRVVLRAPKGGGS